MWILENQTQFAAERTWVRDLDGAEVWITAIKGTFELTSHGQLSLAEVQLPVTLAPNYCNQGTGELLYDTDVSDRKLATDVIVNGKTYAPEGRAVPRWTASLRVGSINKTLLISGDRHWKKGLFSTTLSEPEPILSLPLSYRYAFGGLNPVTQETYAQNPIGRGFAHEASDVQTRNVPNIEYLFAPIRTPKDVVPPAGFSALPTHWQPRLGFAGTYDDAWEKHRHPLLPVDFNSLFYQSAPADQQIPGFLKGGELVEICNLSPVSRLQFYLPKVSFLLRTHFMGGRTEIHRANLHTVIIEPDNHRVVLTWHSRLPCHHDIHLLEKTTIQLKKRVLDEGRESDIQIKDFNDV